MEKDMKELDMRELDLGELDKVSGGDLTRDVINRVCNAYSKGMRMAQQNGYSFDQFWNMSIVRPMIAKDFPNPMDVDLIRKWMKYKWNDIASGR